MKQGLFNHAQLLAYLGEGGDGFVEVFLFMGGTELNANTRLSLGNNREEEADHINSLIQQTGCELLCDNRII